MLERYYGHTTNVDMVERLTKPKTKRFANANKDDGAALGGLGAGSERSKPVRVSKVHPAQNGSIPKGFPPSLDRCP